MLDGVRSVGSGVSCSVRERRDASVSNNNIICTSS